MCAEDLDGAARIASQVAKAPLVRQTKAAVLFHQGLIGAKTGCAARPFDVHFGVIKVRIARIKQPSLWATNRYPGMSERVTDQWNHEHVGPDTGKIADAIESVPCLSDTRPMRLPGVPRDPPLLGAVTHAVEHGLLCDRRADLFREKVHRRMRKIIEPARVVEVEMGEDDVADVPGLKAEPLDLSNGGVALPQLGCVERQKKPAQSIGRIAHVAQAITGVDEDERMALLEQKAVRCETAAKRVLREAVHEDAAEWAGRDAIEMMDSHAPSEEQATGRCTRASIASIAIRTNEESDAGVDPPIAPASAVRSGRNLVGVPSEVTRAPQTRRGTRRDVSMRERAGAARARSASRSRRARGTQ
jgi:hypothetical protein